MKRTLIIILLVFITFQLSGWGFYAHRKINRLAVFTLPQELIPFYKGYIDYISEQAVAADKRRYTDENEAPRHYIDIDHYGVYPFDEIPRRWNDAVSRFTEDTLTAYGILPWTIQRVYYQLVNAFKSRDRDRILNLSANLGHYIGDAHVPLHTTFNYNGQLTGQQGIHGFWESRVPEIFGDGYDYFSGKAAYIDDPLMTAWDIILESHLSLDSVLGFEKELSKSFPEERKYSFEERGATLVRVYSREYSGAYHTMLNGMVERRLRESIRMTGSYWFSAWVDAGQPELSSLVNDDFNKELKKLQAKEERETKGKTHLGRDCD